MNGVETSALLDPGANVSLVNAELVKKLKLASNKKPIKIQTLKTTTETLGCITLTLTIRETTKNIQAHIIKDLRY